MLTLSDRLILNTTTAILGGDTRRPPGNVEAPKIVLFGSQKDSGNGEYRRLKQSLKSGCFGAVVVRTRWNSHSVTTAVRKICKQMNISFYCI
jgi:hypothetical protein